MNDNKTETRTYQVKDRITALVGSLVIVHEAPPPEGFMAGNGTRIFMDGKEIKNVRSIDLHLAIDEAVSVKIDHLVTA